MELEAAIVAKLRTDVPSVGGRIAPVGIPDAIPRPNIIYQRIDTGREHSNDGPVGIADALLQLSCYADQYDQAKALAAAVRSFDGFTGTVGEVFIHSMFLEDESDAPAPPPEGQTRGIAGIQLTFRVAYSE